MSFLFTVAAFILAIGVLVTIHELGHYWAARWCNVKILRFSIGFGRPLCLRRVGPDQTEWVLAALPLGGYVKMADERDDSVEASDRARAFNNKSVWQRIFIVSAGPLANFLLAGVLYWALFVSGMPGTKPYVTAPLPNSVAAQAGFVEFDLITSIAGQSVKTWGDARLLLLDEAVKRGVVEVEVEDAGGQRYSRRLSLAGVGKDDLDKDFLGKVGLGPYRLKLEPVLGEVTVGSAADRAGLRAGDRITAVDGQTVSRWETLVERIVAKPDQAINVELTRSGQAFTTAVTPEKVTENGRTFGRLGVKPKIDQALLDKLGTTVRYGPIDAVSRAVTKVWDMSSFSLRMMGRMLTGDVSWKNLSGPITIADYAGQSASLGWMPYVNFLALISVSLGVLNLLPVPVLDGGQLMYYMAEILKGSPVSDRTMQIGQQVGLALLLGLTAFAFYNDIHRLLTG
ncbi:MAG: RIP metalloprotease RseP [Betaproteobacteria bacterium]|nr:RIP metalloprotease RseP [Betaproteobacteria bacterium]